MTVAAERRSGSVTSPPTGQPKKEEVTVTDPLEGRLVWYEKIQLVLGTLQLLVLLPLTATTVASTVLWDGLDRGFRGQPQDGVIMSFARWVNKKAAPIGEKITRKKEDAYLLPTLILLGGIIPSLFFASLWYTSEHGFNPYLCFAYHVIRLGPYFMNFAYVYTLCHKEGHSYLGLFSGPLGRPLKNVFNWWIGLFYGVLPSSFAYGHSVNHHKYNNGPFDVVTNADKPRDSVRNFICYLPRWSLYATNISTVQQFLYEGEYQIAFSMVLGTLYFVGWFFLMYLVNPTFALWYVLFPLGENILLLACINWCWHAFLNPEDPEDDFVGSVTLLDGPINVLNEDYHVVHHQYPGAHWSDHTNLYKRHLDRGEYHKGPATMFRGTHAFELFFLIILRQYDEIAKRMFDIREVWTHEDKVNVLKNRLRTCWWGPRRNTQIKLQGKEIGNLDMGRPNTTKKDD